MAQVEVRSGQVEALAVGVVHAGGAQHDEASGARSGEGAGERDCCGGGINGSGDGGGSGGGNLFRGVDGLGRRK
jgi:hypothetical protein